ncbi:universal stress protein [Natronosalvus amylolyticus]|uniref:universal stress protein n=1 Tax=Natronosalvus amylolyticus TaxID=2961994 RepID=UPI0020C9ABA6|nr:universal stress protein [Natronosalvus amylolyticus]
MYDTILLPTDGSDNAQLATEHALSMADRHDAELHVLYVAEKTRDDPVQKGLEEKLAEELNKGKDIVDDVENQATNENITTETVVEQGVPRTTIENYAAENDVGLIVIGSTGADSVAEQLLGTVSKYIVNEAPADVFIVRPDTLLS